MKFLKYFYCIFFIAIFSVSIFAEKLTDEDALDKEFLSEKSGVSDSKSFLKDSKWDIFGFIENNNFFHIPGEKDASKHKDIKLEGRGRINLKYGNDFYYGKVVLDGYYFPEKNQTSESASEEIPDYKKNRLEAQEIYIAAGETLQVKLGKQLFSWGTKTTVQLKGTRRQTPGKAS